MNRASDAESQVVPPPGVRRPGNVGSRAWHSHWGTWRGSVPRSWRACGDLRVPAPLARAKLRFPLRAADCRLSGRGRTGLAIGGSVAARRVRRRSGVRRCNDGAGALARTGSRVESGGGRCDGGTARRGGRPRGSRGARLAGCRHARGAGGDGRRDRDSPPQQIRAPRRGCRPAGSHGNPRSRVRGRAVGDDAVAPAGSVGPRAARIGGRAHDIAHVDPQRAGVARRRQDRSVDRTAGRLPEASGDADTPPGRVRPESTRGRGGTFWRRGSPPDRAGGGSRPGLGCAGQRDLSPPTRCCCGLAAGSSTAWWRCTTTRGISPSNWSPSIGR